MEKVKELEQSKNYLTAIYRNIDRLKEFEIQNDYHQKWEVLAQYEKLQTEVNSLLSMYKYRIGRETN